MEFCLLNCLYDSLRMAVPKLPLNQDCHELWSKKRRRQMREQEGLQQQQQHSQGLPPGKMSIKAAEMMGGP